VTVPLFCCFKSIWGIIMSFYDRVTLAFLEEDKAQLAFLGCAPY